MKTKNFLIRICMALAIIIILGAGAGLIAQSDANAANGTYKILAWNDLGMHCYNRDFSDLAVLPPYNTLWVQVLKAGDPPTLVTTGITVEYFYADNTYSVGKTNFWDYSQPLFGVTLAPNVGLKGKGLSGTMDLSGDHYVAEGIPVTEYSDSAPTTSQPYQLATVIVKDSTTGAELARTQVVTPVSSEMRCDICHSDTGKAKPDNPTGKVETNILQLHDEEEGSSLMTSRPVLCAKCHSSNALGAPGEPGVSSLSNAMHNKHDGESPNTLNGCYNCHPGPQTKCLRDTMSTEGMTCIDCHGGMSTVKTNPNPWLNEPRCDTCHDSGEYNQNNALYRFSTEHGGLYCEACHDSTHAVAPSREANDAIKFIALQGKNGPIDKCEVCHTVTPTSGGPHGITLQIPTVLGITRLNPTPTKAVSVNFTVTFSEAVTGVDAADFSLTTTGIAGAKVTAVNGSGATRTVTVSTGTGNGTLRLNIIDNDTIVNETGNKLGGTGSGNGNYTAGQTYAIDKTSPKVVSSVRVNPSPTNLASVSFTVTFSEIVKGVDTADFSLTRSAGIAGASITAVSGSGATRTVTVNTGTGNGTLRLNVIDNDTILDRAGNKLGGAGVGNGNYTAGQSYMVDKTPPKVVSSVRVNPTPTNANSVSFTVKFSEVVTGVDAADFSLTLTGIKGARVTAVSGSGATRTVTVSTGTGNGTLRLNVIDNDTIMDKARNKLGGTGLRNGNYTAGQTYTIRKP